MSKPPLPLHIHTPETVAPIFSEVSYTTKLSWRHNLCDDWKRSFHSGNTEASHIWGVTMQLSIFIVQKLIFPLFFTPISGPNGFLSTRKRKANKHSQPEFIQTSTVGLGMEVHAYNPSTREGRV